MLPEIIISSSTPIPRAYGFLPKGDRYKTLHCRKLTREANKQLYVVVDKKIQIGLRVPTMILHTVHAQAKQTLTTRRAAVAKKDDADVANAAAEITKQFPKIPDSEKEAVLKHGFKKHSGRVGRTSNLSLSQKVLFAISAHVRHTHTEYDALLRSRRIRSEKARKDARKATRKKTENVLRGWGYKKRAK
jgi:hypothetical protein